MPRTSLVLLSLILSSLMRHQRLLGRFGLRFNGLASAMVEDAFALSERKLFGLGDAIDLLSSSRGAEVGAGPLDAMDDCEESDRTEGESNAGDAMHYPALLDAWPLS